MLNNISRKNNMQAMRLWHNIRTQDVYGTLKVEIPRLSSEAFLSAFSRGPITKTSYDNFRI